MLISQDTNLMKAFIAPNHNPLLGWIADTLFHPLLKAMHNINEVIISESDKAVLRTLKDHRLLFFTNHPSTAEPPLVYHMSNIIGARFKYMASRQVFDWGMGAVGKAISNIGAFSVIAGINDKESLKTARAALAEKSGKLVLFPEGEPTSGENDNLMPFQEGIAALSFWAMDDARKIDPNADITILPGFIKYVIDARTEVILDDLDHSLKKIESKYNISPGNKNILRRFLTIGKYLLLEAEEMYNIKDAESNDFDYRIGRVRHAILDRIADDLRPVNYDYKADAIHKLRNIFALIEMLSIGYPDPKLPKLNNQQLEHYKKESIKAFDFIVMKRDYILSYPSPERLYEWMDRYESYVFGTKPRALGGVPSHLSRKAYITLANHFPLSEYFFDYKKKKKETVSAMLTRLRGDLQKMLDSSQKLSQPLFKPYDVGGDI